MSHKRHIPFISQTLSEATTVDMNALSGEETRDEAMARFHVSMEWYGFVVVANVLSPEELTKAEDLFDEDLFSIVELPDKEKKQLNCFRKLPADEAVSAARRFPLPLGRLNAAFASDYGVPQGQAAWYCRTRPSVRNVFAALFGGCEDLCVGMDNVFFCPDREDRTTPDEDRADNLWPHADQSIHAEGGADDCFQAIMYLWPGDRYSSTTVVWPGSHKAVYQQLMGTRCFSHHFCRLPSAQNDEFVSHAVRVAVPAGGMIVWNSKLIHQGWNIGPRLAVPICMEPKKRRSSDALLSKKEACFYGYPTTHWASLGIWHGCSSIAPGGTKALPLRTKAHLWMFPPEIQQLCLKLHTDSAVKPDIANLPFVAPEVEALL